jgi:hypothetical protein
MQESIQTNNQANKQTNKQKTKQNKNKKTKTNKQTKQTSKMLDSQNKEKRMKSYWKCQCRKDNFLLGFAKECLRPPEDQGRYHHRRMLTISTENMVEKKKTSNQSQSTRIANLSMKFKSDQKRHKIQLNRIKRMTYSQHDGAWVAWKWS